MNLKEFIKKERKIWHAHFIPSLIAAGLVAALGIVLEFTLSNIILFASVGASAFILTNSKSHHLTKLHTATKAYIFSAIISLILFLINKSLPLHFGINIFLSIFIVGMALYLADAVHPPAVSASLAFVLLNKPATTLLIVFVIIIALLIFVRFLTYIFSQHLNIKKFFKEFEKEL